MASHAHAHAHATIMVATLSRSNIARKPNLSPSRSKGNSCVHVCRWPTKAFLGDDFTSVEQKLLKCNAILFIESDFILWVKSHFRSLSIYPSSLSFFSFRYQPPLHCCIVASWCIGEATGQWGKATRQQVDEVRQWATVWWGEPTSSGKAAIQQRGGETTARRQLATEGRRERRE